MAEIASPKATGGGGPAFEVKVQASFLSFMLVNGRYPCLPDGIARLIRFQAKQLGYQTDDIFLELETSSRDVYRLLAQAKANISFTQSDSEFRQTLIAAWTDFTNPGLFNRNNDVLLIVSGPGSKKEICHFRPLLNWSHTSASAQEYFSKVSTKDYASKDTQNYLSTIQSILQKHLGTAPSQEELWRFMKCLRWISYDFDEPSGHDLASIQTMLRLGMRADSVTTPAAIWSKLLEIASDYNPAAGTLTRESLVAGLGDCIVPGSVTNTAGLQRLKEHGEVILSLIQTHFRDGAHIDRKSLLQEMWNLLSEERLLLVSGVAGVGKSATIKETLSTFAKHAPTFILKADELDRPHLHQALREIGVEESIQELSSRFGLLENKIFVVESLEKLLEADSQDAFCQLLHLLRDDPSWIVVLSCRSPALGTILDAVLIPQSIFPARLEIALLSDRELQQAASDRVGLANLFHNESVKDLLRIPMYLNYARQIDWQRAGDSIEGLDVHHFEQVLWKNVIRKDTHQKDGLHFSRERCFIALAVARAKAMRAFVPADPYDAAALQHLEADEVVIRTEEGVAPAHDLFEEWAINRQIEYLFRRLQDDLARLFNEIGGEPAMRRGFRTWLVGQLAREGSNEIADFITMVLQNDDLPGFWRDEAIVAVLLSTQADRYFDRQKDALLSNDLSLLTRIIHLLRTACKEPDVQRLEGMPLTAAGRDLLKTTFLKPTGSGWSATLAFIGDHLDVVTSAQPRLLLGLLQDWVSGLAPGRNLPREARTVGLIALHLLNLARSTYKDDLRKEISRVAFCVSSAVTEELHALFVETLQVPLDEENEYDLDAPVRMAHTSADEFRFFESILDAAVESICCIPLCQSMPADVVALAKKQFVQPLSSQVIQRASGIDLEHYFGMESQYGMEMHPASALQGPFLWLLQSDPDQGIELVLYLINTATEWYACSGLDSAGGERLPQVTVRLNDGREILQYFSGRLWGAYRGLTVMPDVLQSALMALEKWLVDSIKGGKDMGSYFDQLLCGSRSSAISAVLAGIATGYGPYLGEHVLPLLRTRAFVMLDLSRRLAEDVLIVDMAKAMRLPKLPNQQIYIAEREGAQRMPHRKRDLEWLALNLQQGPLREQVQLIIDEHRRKLPPLESQTDEDRTWRLALHRMDRRRYETEEAIEEGWRILTHTPPERDIQEMQSRVLPDLERREKMFRVSMWTMREFNQGPGSEAIFEDWSAAVEWAKDTYEQFSTKSPVEQDPFCLAGAIYIAALSIRDHLCDLNEDEVVWCSKTLMEKVLQGLKLDPWSPALGSGVTDGTAAAAYVLPLQLDVPGVDQEHLRLAIAGSLTFPDPRVRAYAIQGAHCYLWPRHTALAKSCLIGLIEFARLSEMERHDSHEAGSDWRDPARAEKEEAVRARYREVVEKLRIAMARGEIAEDVDPCTVTFDRYSVYELSSVVQLLPVEKDLYDSEPLLKALLQETLSAAKKEEADNRTRGELPHQFKGCLNDRASYYVLRHDMETAKRVCEPIVAAIDECPEYVTDYVESLIESADREQAGAHFWEVWRLFADAVFAPDRLKGKYLRHRDGELIKTLLLSRVPWKESVNEWKTLTESPDYLEPACKVASKTKPGFEALLALLYSVGGFYLPGAFTWLCDALPHVNVAEVFGEENNRFTLETLLQREIHLRGIQIRSNSSWQRSVLGLLDVLVDFGSSRAFQLRELIIRPPKNRIHSNSERSLK